MDPTEVWISRNHDIFWQREEDLAGQAGSLNTVHILKIMYCVFFASLLETYFFLA